MSCQSALATLLRRLGERSKEIEEGETKGRSKFNGARETQWMRLMKRRQAERRMEREREIERAPPESETGDMRRGEREVWLRGSCDDERGTTSRSNT